MRSFILSILFWSIVFVGALFGVLWLTVDREVTKEVPRTGELSQRPLNTVAGAQARIEAHNAQVRTEIRYIDREVRRNVSALTPNDVAIGIQREIELFRRSELRPSRVDDAGAGVLPGGGSGTRRVGRAPIQAGNK